MKKAKLLASRVALLLIELEQIFVVNSQKECVCIMTELKEVGQISSFMFFSNKTVITIIGQDSVNVDLKLKDLQIRNGSIEHLTTSCHGR